MRMREEAAGEVPAWVLPLAAQQVRKLMPDGKMYVWQSNVAGAGAVSVDAKGHVYAVERTCTDPAWVAVPSADTP